MTAPTEGRVSRPLRAAAVVAVIGLVLTTVCAWAAYRADRSTEERLLETQTRQAAAVLTTAIFVIEQPLTTALRVQAEAGPDGNPAVFRRTMAAHLGDETALYVSASLWRQDGERFTRLAAVGKAPGMDPVGVEVQEFLDRAVASRTSVVERVEVGDRTRFAYALADPETGFVVKVERLLPANRRAPVDRDSAYSQIHYAIYLGEETSLEALTTTDQDPADLPLDGMTSTTTVPFGDTVLTLVTSPTHHLGSPLSQRLPLILLIGGLLLTVATALIARKVVSTGIRAEDDSRTISTLYQRLDGLYEEQRETFVRLQRALLPHVLPDIRDFAIASAYVAGSEGVEIGGDWYSIIDVGEDHFGFVVGDVSGRGVDAVAEMARARFTLRAYLVDGDAPADALAKCSRQFDVTVDEHIVTAIVGRGTWRTGELVIANAGHPLPLLMDGDHCRFVTMPIGPPLGVGPSSYETTTVALPAGATFLAYTDGLVERRDEDIDTGMDRLLAAARRHRDLAVDDLLPAIREDMSGDGAPDDIAMLALRRAVEVGVVGTDAGGDPAAVTAS